MKKRYGLLCLSLSLSSLSFAQKTEFGFVLKAGNYGIPINEKPQSNFFQGDSQTISRGLGSNYSLGLSYTVPLNNQLSIGAEFLYRHLTSSYASENIFGFWDGISTRISKNNVTEKVMENSFSLPIFLQYKPKKAQKWSFIASVGTSRAFSATIMSSATSSINNQPATTALNTNYYGHDQFLLNLNFNTEIAYQLDKSTSIGLAYTHEKQNEPDFTRFSVINPVFVDCLCFFSTDTFRGNLNSFSVSLRHNILH